MSEFTLDYLKEKKKEIISRFIDGKAKDFPEKLSRLLDDYLCNRFEGSHIGLKIDFVENPYAIIALGSYGRMEPCLRSDLALLFLFYKSIPEEAEDLIKEFIYPLWDGGFEIAHVTRTVDECIKSASEKTEVLMSLLDGRFICGVSRLFFDLSGQISDRIVSVAPHKIVNTIVEQNRGRHDRFGDSSFLLEPNLKEGKGGLGDYYAMLSIARIRANVRIPQDLETSGFLSAKEFADLSKAVSFVLKVRNLLHHVTRRKCDQLFMEYQPKIAELLSYDKIARKGGEEAVERFMGDLHGNMRVIKHQYRIFLSELGYTGDQDTGGKISYKNTRVRGLGVNEKNMLVFDNSKDIPDSPELMVKIYAESASMNIPVSVEASRVIRDAAPEYITAKVRKSRSVTRAFEKILMTPAVGINALEEMLRTGLLSCLIPEFRGITNRIQYNEYHMYPVDTHSLMTVKKAGMFGVKSSEDDIYNRVFESLDQNQRIILLWASLLHDIGKEDVSGLHSETGALHAKRILDNLGYGSDISETVSFLVKEHLFLIKTATRRDIQDEETALFCARRIMDASRLKMLYLLTVADSMSTGPKAWNDWTSSLLKNLFERTLHIFGKDEFVPEKTVETTESKKAALKTIMTERGIDGKTADKSINLLSLRYLLNMDVPDIISHIDLYNTIGDKPFAWHIEGQGTPGHRTVTIAARSKPGLFSKIAGVMTLLGFNILDAQIFTWKNNIALDVFHLSPPADLLFESEKWKDAGHELTNALAHDVNLMVRLDEMISWKKTGRLNTLKKPTRIEVDNDTSGFFTIIEVHTYDFPGLLFLITDTLFRCGLDIYVSKIATSMDQVVDIFYVRNLFGDKVTTAKQIDSIKKDIHRVIEQRLM